jgi:hypothetical protein
MANVLRALDTSNAWSSDDSDEETHFREMVQLSIQARRLEPKGTGDDAVSEDAANNRAARDTVLDSSDDDAVEDDAVEDDAVEDDDADARGHAASSESPRHLSRGDGDVSVDSPGRPNPSASSRRFGHHRENTRSLTEVLASMSAAPAMEPAAPELVAALAALGIDVADGKKTRIAKGSNGDEGWTKAGRSPFGSLSSRFGCLSVPNEKQSRDRSATFALPVRTGGGYEVRGFRAPEPEKRHPRAAREKSAHTTERRPPAARRATPPRAYRDVAGVHGFSGRVKHRSTGHERLEIYQQEVVRLGRLTDAEHYGYWAHAWWSDDDADAVASAMSTAPVPPTPFPVGFVIRTVLRETETEGTSGGKENSRFGGRVAARGGADFANDAAGREWGAVECSVRERHAGRPWEGPEFVIRWVGADGCSSAECGARIREKKRAFAGSSGSSGSSGFFRGATPKAAVAEFARALQRREASRAPPARARLPDAEALFGFSSRAVADALAEHAAAAGRAVARLRAPHGVGLATLRVDALDRESDETDSKNGLKKKKTARVAEWRSSRGAFPLLPGYRVTFALCAGTAAACEVVRSNETPGGVAFAVTVRDGGAVAKRVRSRCPDRAWAKLKAERRVLIVSGALDARLALDRTEAFLGAHLFGFESPAVALMAAQSEAAAVSGDAFLLAEPFLRDVYGARASFGKEKEKRRSVATERVSAEYL